MFLGEIVNDRGRGFNGRIEAVQGFEELFPAEGLGSEGGDDLFDLPGDDVFADEIGVVEDLAEEEFYEVLLLFDNKYAALLRL